MIPCFIPARSGSRSLHNKNLRLLKGKPLIAWAVEAAVRSKVDQVFVSTDSKEIGREAQLAGQCNIIDRPPELAEDVPSELVILHALSHVKKLYPTVWDPVVTIQCTTPLVRPSDINKALETYSSKSYNSLVSVTHCREFPEWMFRARGRLLEPLTVHEDDLSGDWGIRQTLEPLYRPNGAIYITNLQFLEDKKALIGQPLGFYEMPLSRGWDVDEPVDLTILEALADYKGDTES